MTAHASQPGRAMLRVALYARFSSDLQRDASIDDQLRVCTAHAMKQGWTIAGRFTDAALSGALADRPGYQALLAAMRAGEVEIVLAESLDRFSRDLEHAAALYKQAQFAGVRIVTLAEGEISEMAVGLKGTMGALYLKDLAAKTHRGAEGRIRQGRAFGTPPYGYRVVRRLGPNGELERGLRAIEPAEAAIVRRVFQAYLDGTSPLAIARALNAEGVPGPDGRPWTDAYLRGRPSRNSGILRNPIYAGLTVWNRFRSVKDPVTGRGLRRANPADAVVEAEVPHLAIIDRATFARAQARLAAEAAPRPEPGVAPRFWERRRKHYLLTGKVVCGVCGGPFTLLGKDYLGCLRRKQGACRNHRSVRRGPLEAQVLDALARQLMRPDLLAAFADAFRAEWTRIAAELSTATEADQHELTAVERKLANLVEAIADGLRAPGLQTRLDELEARRAALRAALAVPRPTLPALHPRLAEVYRDRVARLSETLVSGTPSDALEAARALIDQVIVSAPDSDDDPPRIELVGHLAEMLRAAGVSPGRTTQPAAPSTDAVDPLDAIARSIKAAPGANGPPGLTLPSWPR